MIMQSLLQLGHLSTPAGVTLEPAEVLKILYLLNLEQLK